MGPKTNRTPSEKQPSAWYASAMERLLDVVQELSRTRNVDEVTAIVRLAARDLTGADGATFVLREGENCYYAEENAIAPLWKGKRFPMKTCISGWVMMNKGPAVIEDIYQDPRIPHDAYRPTFVKSLAMVPIRRGAPLGAIGNYWALQRTPSDEEVAILQALADTTSVALENAKLYLDLQHKIEVLQEREARIHEQRDALEIFTRALTHDLKEPMRTINSFTQLIGQQGPQQGKAADYFRHVEEASARMLMLLNTVFVYLQLDEQSDAVKKSIDMNAVLREGQAHLASLIRENGATIKVKSLPHLYGHPDQLALLFQHLIDNAIRHSREPVSIQIEAEQKQGEWLFRVSDNGPGIDPRYHETIFEPFKRMCDGEDGAGLGLAICRKIVELHGGHIACESEPGGGAAFVFNLPQEVPIRAL